MRVRAGRRAGWGRWARLCAAVTGRAAGTSPPPHPRHLLSLHSTPLPSPRQRPAHPQLHQRSACGGLWRRGRRHHGCGRPGHHLCCACLLRWHAGLRALPLLRFKPCPPACPPARLPACLPPALPADCSSAFQKAIDAASASKAAASGAGVAVEIPAGTFVLKKEIAITRSNVVLRGAGVSVGAGTGAGRGPTSSGRWCRPYALTLAACPAHASPALQPSKTKIYIPTTLSELRGKSPGWAFGGGFLRCAQGGGGGGRGRGAGGGRHAPPRHAPHLRLLLAPAALLALCPSPLEALHPRTAVQHLGTQG